MAHKNERRFSLFNLLSPGRAEPRNVDEQLVTLLERARRQFETGIPEYGVPPLDPLALDNVIFPIYQKGVIKADVSLEKIFITGLQGFIIKSLNFKMAGLSLSFEFLVPDIVATSKYKVKGKVGSFIPFNPKGDARFEAKMVNVKGLANLDTKNGYLTLRALKLQFDIDRTKVNLSGLGLMSPTVNWILTRLSADVVQRQKDEVSKMASDIAMDMANQILGSFTLSDLISG